MTSKKFLVLVALTIFPALTSAQGLLTVVGVSVGLQTALNRLDESVKSAFGEAKEAGNSLQGNVQNVLTDFNGMFTDQTTRIDNIADAQQRQFASNARSLVASTEQAATAIANHTFEQVRESIYEADILAYNTLSALPCRTQQPRIVYIKPAQTALTGDVVDAEIRGNFLALEAPRGKLPPTKVSINGQQIGFIRNPQSIQIKIPKSITEKITEATGLPISVENLVKLERKFFIAICRESATPLNQGVTLRVLPRIVFNVQVSITAIHNSWSKPQEILVATGGNHTGCGSNSSADASGQFCAPKDTELIWPPKVVASGNIPPSKIDGLQPSGTRCVHVQAHAQGNGRSWLGANCTGRGNISYTVVLTGRRKEIKTLKNQTFEQVALPGQTSMTYHYADAPTEGDLTWKYQVDVTATRGKTALFTDSVSEARSDSKNVEVAFRAGTLTVTLPPDSKFASQ
jgi:hypothetical protein